MKKIIIIIFAVFFILSCAKAPKKYESGNNKKITKDSLIPKNDLLGEINIKKESDKIEIDTLSDIKNIDNKNKKEPKKQKPLKKQTTTKIADDNRGVMDKKGQNKIVDDKKNQTISYIKEQKKGKIDDLNKGELKKVITTKKLIKQKKIISKIDESKHSFVKKKNKINGNWSFKREDGKTYIIFYGNFKTKKGPDLEIFLSKKNIENVNSKNALIESIFIENLTSNKGEQKYLIPSSIDLSQYKSIIIHCKKYAVLWGGSSI